MSIPCPQLVVDYNKNMGGVDTHDQFRLQRYSLQLASTMKKYYKTLFLGLMDMAFVNMFIIHKCHRSAKCEKSLTHADFLATLQAELLKLRPEDFGSPGVDSEGIKSSIIYYLFSYLYHFLNVFFINDRRRSAHFRHRAIIFATPNLSLMSKIT